MAAISADRDLLFGLLALQNGLIDQGRLVAAFQAWTLEKSRPLAEHLIARGNLDVDQRGGVEARGSDARGAALRGVEPARAGSRLKVQAGNAGSAQGRLRSAVNGGGSYAHTAESIHRPEGTRRPGDSRRPVTFAGPDAWRELISPFSERFQQASLQ